MRVLSSFLSLWWLRLLLPALLLVSTASAQQPEVTAELTPNPMSPNQIATYSITIENANPSGVPQLRLPAGWSSAGNVSTQNEISIVNGLQSITVRFSWAVTCAQEGTYTLPAQDVPVGQRTLKTNEVQVEVKQGAQPPAPDGPSQDQNNGLGALEPILQMRMDKTEFYQGEIVPVHATLYLPRAMQLRRLGLIEVEKSDLAIQRFPQQADQSLETLNGQRYVALAFRSSLSALKPGKMKVGPAKTELIVDVPLRGGGGFPFGFTPTDERKVTVKAVSIPITVLPLPAEGRPPGFSGAVGDFTMTATASVTEASVGDPVAVDVMIQGQGNFDAIEAPKLSEAAGWKTYPSKRYSVDTGDPNTADLMNRKLGFNTILVPEKVMAEIPAFEFSFFSPRTKQYVHLRSAAIPIQIKASANASAPAAAGSTSTAGPQAPPPPPAPEADITDILMPVAPTASFATAAVPLLSDQRFLMANAALFVAFLALIGFTLWQRIELKRRESPDFALAQRWQEVAAPGLSEAEFYRRAVHYVLKTSPGPLPESVHPIFAAYEALNFAGPGAGTQPVDGAKRAEVLALLKKLPRSAPPARTSAAAVVALLLCAMASAAQAAPQDDYQAAAQALEKSDFATAQKLGEKLVREGNVGPEVFTLLGHAAYKLGQPGMAAVWYQRAQVFPAAAPEIRQNLRHIGEKIHFFTFERNAWLERVGFWMSSNAWLLCSAAGAWLAIFCVTFLVLGLRPPFQGWAIAFLVVGLLACAGGVVGFKARPGFQDLQSLAFVIAPNAQAHTAATAISGSVIAVPPGSVVRTLYARGNWSYVEIPQMGEPLRGWLAAGQLAPWWPYGAERLP